MIQETSCKRRVQERTRLKNSRPTDENRPCNVITLKRGFASSTRDTKSNFMDPAT